MFKKAKLYFAIYIQIVNPIYSLIYYIFTFLIIWKQKANIHQIAKTKI